MMTGWNRRNLIMKKICKNWYFSKIGAFNVNIESYWGKTNNILNAFSGNSSYYTANLGFDKFNTSINIYGSYYKTSRYQSANQKCCIMAEI